MAVAAKGKKSKSSRRVTKANPASAIQAKSGSDAAEGDSSDSEETSPEDQAAGQGKDKAKDAKNKDAKDKLLKKSESKDDGKLGLKSQNGDYVKARLKITPEQLKKLNEIERDKKIKNVRYPTSNLRWFCLFFLRLLMCLADIAMIIVLFSLPGFGEKFLHVLPAYGNSQMCVLVAIFSVSAATNLKGAFVVYYFKTFVVWAQKCIVIKCHVLWLAYMLFMHVMGFVVYSVAILNLANVFVPKDLRMILHSYNSSEDIHYFVDHLQSGYSCCGIHGPADWRMKGDTKATISLPQSCCSAPKCRYGILDHAENKTLHGKGCYIAVMEGIEYELKIKACLFGIIAILQISLLFLTVFSLPNFKMLKKFFFLHNLFSNDDPTIDFRALPRAKEIETAPSSDMNLRHGDENNANNYVDAGTEITGDTIQSNFHCNITVNDDRSTESERTRCDERTNLIGRICKEKYKSNNAIVDDEDDDDDDDGDDEDKMELTDEDYKLFENYMIEEYSKKKSLINSWLSDNKYYLTYNSNDNCNKTSTVKNNAQDLHSTKSSPSDEKLNDLRSEHADVIRERPVRNRRN
ncbi:hypothetical protein HELRODRAFT_182056 [Helobdella robusta]|uniref:Tetraspanin n=1 Tax=Helobdella robusta TaxID=6412 RepID=T1FHN9_HELRO|nr:hypothetical protein HELRODRAFT_182056 [Helobdella robusta]ESN91878.1 hypothetical protein HELRODRAFT_182056 [Helobdella robusta]